MPRKKVDNRELLLTHVVCARVSENVFKRLDGLTKSSDCHTVGEVARRILSKERITVFQKDGNLDAVMEQLTAIHRELNAIGANINQVTRYFHTSDRLSQKTFQALKIADRYKEVGSKVDVLMNVIKQSSKKWLQK